MFEITQKMQIMFISLVAAAIEGELLAMYFSQKNQYYWASSVGIDDPSLRGFNLQIASAAFMIFGFVLIIFVGMMKKRFQKFIIIGNIIIIVIAIIIGCVGMGKTYPYYVIEDLDIYYFNLPLAYWFIEVMLMVVAVMFDYILFVELSVQPQKNKTTHVEIASIPILPK